MTLGLGHDAIGHQALGSPLGGSIVGFSTGASFVMTTVPAPLNIAYASTAASFTLTTVPSTYLQSLVAKAAAFFLNTFPASFAWSGLVTTSSVPDTTGTSADIWSRVKQLIPNRWFAWSAPYRDAVGQSLSDIAAWCYRLIQYARAQIRLATMYGIWLDMFSFDYLARYLPRKGLDDDAYRARIKATILKERVTRVGMLDALVTFTGKVPTIFEPWNTYDTGGYSTPGGKQLGSFGYGVGQGGYGNMNLPAQAFIIAHTGSGAGVPGVDGYGSNIGGYGAGSIEYVGQSTEVSGITSQDIYDLINATKPTGSICWTQVLV